MISIEGLRKRYPGETTDVLRDVHLRVGEGEFVAIVGPSGSGKSTLLHILGGLDTHFQGNVQVAGTSLSGMSDEALSHFRNHIVGFVFQSFHLIPNVSALENVMLPIHFSLKTDKDDAAPRAKSLLERVGLEGKSHLLPSQLSGGERQRVAIARALFMKPRVLLCDEPTGNLDAATGAGVIELFKALNREKLTVVAVTHEDAMRNAASRVVEFRNGQLHEASRLMP